MRVFFQHVILTILLFYTNSVLGQQDALNYFGFDGIYDPNNKIFDGNNNNPAETFIDSGETVYNYSAFNEGFSKLHAIAEHEALHRAHIIEGLPNISVFKLLKNMEEYRTYISQYKSQGLYYKNHGLNFTYKINMYGSEILKFINEDRFLQYSGYDTPMWHFIYKIPRRW